MKRAKENNQSQLHLPLTFSQICPQQQKDAIKADLKEREAQKNFSKQQ